MTQPDADPGTPISLNQAIAAGAGGDAGPALTNPATDAPDPGNTDPAELVAPLDADDDVVSRLTALTDAPESESGDEQLGY